METPQKIEGKSPQKAVLCQLLNSYLSYYQQINSHPSIRSFSPRPSWGHGLTSLACSTSILRGLMNTCSNALQQTALILEKSNKYEACVQLSGLSDQTAALLNVIIVMQQWVSLSDEEMKSISELESNWSRAAAVESKPQRAASSEKNSEFNWTLVYFPLRPPAHSRCAPCCTDTGSLCPLKVSANCFFSFLNLL